MNDETIKDSKFATYNKNLYGEVIHIQNQEEHDHYQEYIKLFGESNEQNEIVDEIG